MITEFKTEFNRVAAIAGGTFTTKKTSELEDFLQGYDFSMGLINFVPMERYSSEIGASSQMIYKGVCKIQFLTKAVKSDNFEDTKDALIDLMVGLSERFYRELYKNENQIFISPKWDFSTEILRQYTSNYVVGVETTIAFDTACNRL